MTASARRTLTTCLLIAALVLAITGFGLRSRANHEAEVDRIRESFEGALGGVEDDVTVNQTPAIVCWVLAGFAGLSGVIFLATARPEDRADEAPREAPSRDEP